MANQILVVDTSLLLEHFRKTKRENSRLFRQIDHYDQIFISVVTEYEVLVGATGAQAAFWQELLAQFQIMPLDSRTFEAAIAIKADLKRKRKSISLADLFIAATAVTLDLPFDTLNRKDFMHISQLQLLPDEAGF